MPSITAGIQEYIQAMITRIQGMKVLILDQETLGIISMVYSQSEILQNEVFLTERIDAEQEHEKLKHLNAICFIRPTNQNFLLLTKELKNPKYNEYHVFFSNCVPHNSLERLAACDEYECVHQVQEFFADVYALNHDLFSLNLPSTIRLSVEDSARWTSYEESVFERMLEGVLAACLTLRMLPSIRYQKKSELTSQLAHKLQRRIEQEQSLFDTIEQERGAEPRPVLLVLDRRNDPVTPLLNQWTYQAMLHELLTMENNRIDMRGTADDRPELQQIVMSTTSDSFFAENALANFGELGENVKSYLESYQKQTKSTTQMNTIEEMQRFVDEYPEFRKMSGNVSKHVAVVHELSHIVNTQGLFAASEIEQEIACSEDRSAHFRQVQEMLSGTEITNMERLRLVLLYALRYEHQPSIEQLKDLLRAKGVGKDQANLVNHLLNYAGSYARDGDLFHNKSMWAKGTQIVSRGLQGVDNVYTQHKSEVSSLAKKLMDGSLKESSYPFVAGTGVTPPTRSQVNHAIVFMVGGTTFEEARDISHLNKSFDGNKCIILGGTTIHNSRSFLADIAQLSVDVGGIE